MVLSWKAINSRVKEESNQTVWERRALVASVTCPEVQLDA